MLFNFHAQGHGLVKHRRGTDPWAQCRCCKFFWAQVRALPETHEQPRTFVLSVLGSTQFPLASLPFQADSCKLEAFLFGANQYKVHATVPKIRDKAQIR